MSLHRGWVLLVVLLLGLLPHPAPAADKPAPAAPAKKSQAPGELVAPFTAAQARAAQDASAKSLGTQRERTNSIGMKLMLVPSGKFQMGSPDNDSDAEDDEKPQVAVTLTKPFYLGVHEVTQQEYEQVMGTNPSDFSRTGEGSEDVKGKETRNFPVEKVSWFDTLEFCNKLSIREKLSPCYRLTEIKQAEGSIKSPTSAVLAGTGYRLPSEAEWEFACRAGTTTRHWFANDPAKLSDYAWWGGYIGNGNAENERYPHPVGTKKGNPFGLFDMHGNVWEWCQDESGEKRPGGIDPLVENTGEYRVNRGGSWGDGTQNCRSAARAGMKPGFFGHFLGFRVAQSPGNKPSK